MKRTSESMAHGRFWSLWDMINYQLFGLVGWLTLVEQERGISKRSVESLLAAAQMPQDEAERIQHEILLQTENGKSRIEGLLGYAEHLCTQLDLVRTEDRVIRFRQYLRQIPISPVAVNQQLQTLHEALHDDLKLKYFFAYKDEKAARFLRVEIEWQKALKAFPSIQTDAGSAADCYALGHNNQCVFSCMMILEIGIKALADSVGVLFDVQQWKNILDEIESKIGEIRKHGIPGMDKATKNDRLQFLSEAAKEFFYFKDAWRNHVAHGRGRYDEHQALGVYEHTRSLMNHLASQLSETP